MHPSWGFSQWLQDEICEWPETKVQSRLVPSSTVETLIIRVSVQFVDFQLLIAIKAKCNEDFLAAHAMLSKRQGKTGLASKGIKSLL